MFDFSFFDYFWCSNPFLSPLADEKAEEDKNISKLKLAYHSGNSKRLKIIVPVPNEWDISSSIIPVPIKTIVKRLGLTLNQSDLYGSTKAKIHTDIFDSIEERGMGKYILVTGLFIYI